MMKNNTSNRWLNEVRIIKKALGDPDFLKQLLVDPKAAIEEELSISLGQLKVTVFREDEHIIHLIIPQRKNEMGTTEMLTVFGQKTGNGYIRKLIEIQAIEEVWAKGNDTFHLTPEDLTTAVIKTLNLEKIPDDFRVQLHHEEEDMLYISVPYYASKPYLSFNENE